ncbi:MAG: EutP/PduV family microcompartment system protein [Treponema sp.]|jgi:ethanolamine utilization protein EutP|nr:EutP/PduV family microcompartment system protein [Treponema sp.]
MEIVGKEKPIMLVGPTGAGKSTLIKVLNRLDGEIKKTESITYLPYAIDTPGEMIHIPFLYNALILNSARASMVLFLISAKRYPRLPAKLALALKVPAIGIVSQIDGAEEAGIRRAKSALTVAGLKIIFNVSSVTGEGIDALREFIVSAGISLGYSKN